jgi:RecB family exonuclease
LRHIPDIPEFVRKHVRAAMATNIPPRIREAMPARYPQLEAERLTHLISEWLAYEQSRVDFEVAATEMKTTCRIGPLSLDLRLDRLDRLNDRTLLVIDYKTGNVSPTAWDLPRPEDIQLPLYAGFGIDQHEAIGGLVFAKVRPGDMCFAGKVANAAATLDSKPASALVKHRLELDQLLAWREAIEQLTRDFLSGRADVNPRDLAKTCDRCGLQTLCRINERPSLIEESEAEVADA